MSASRRKIHPILVSARNVSTAALHFSADTEPSSVNSTILPGGLSRRRSAWTLSRQTQSVPGTAIMPGPNTYTGQIVKSLFQQHELALDISMSTNYLETIKMMVSIGLGWSVLPRTMIDQSLKILTIPNLAMQRTLGYVYHRNRSLSNAASAFVDTLNQCSD